MPIKLKHQNLIKDGVFKISESNGGLRVIHFFLENKINRKYELTDLLERTLRTYRMRLVNYLICTGKPQIPYEPIKMIFVP